jgi:hypothetical protein
MTEIKTLDDKIREQARKDLRFRIEHAVKLFKTSVGYVDGYMQDLKTDRGEQVNFEAVMWRIEKSLIALQSAKAEEREVEAFMQKVESLQGEVDRLKNFAATADDGEF